MAVPRVAEGQTLWPPWEALLKYQIYQVQFNHGLTEFAFCARRFEAILLQIKPALEDT